jgi:DNA-binding Xre family transcriptional regulator
MVRLTIKELAAQRGIRQGELAAKSGVTPQLLNRYWNNNTLRVELEQLGKIAKALGVRTGDLLSDDEISVSDAA